MGKMIECQIDSVRVSLTNQDRIIVLKDKTQERYVPIWIGLFEAESITIALQNIAVARPLTHDLMLAILNKIGARLLRVEITGLVSETYYANLVIETDKTLFIDCRPSDALALVVRTGAPIFVDEDILEEAGIQPEDVLVFDDGEPEDETEETGDLSAFEDFLEDLGKGGDQDDSFSPEPPDPGPETD
ncbi:MAG: bifunctional nuclease family protein [Anaerolineaceae bacterium]|nr:bifunctional nuclease family protein [Anaerolineaceae bacterium]MDD4576932.1 bifunctional nuclease family protein [Anaerolineaceae bacterium]